jgi:hypothetical protein
VAAALLASASATGIGQQHNTNEDNRFNEALAADSNLNEDRWPSRACVREWQRRLRQSSWWRLSRCSGRFSRWLTHSFCC